jgi:hypothetical protein
MELKYRKAWCSGGSSGFALLGWAKVWFLTGAAVSAIGFLLDGASSGGARFCSSWRCARSFCLLELFAAEGCGAAARLNDPVYGAVGGPDPSQHLVTPVLCVMSAGTCRCRWL